MYEEIKAQVPKISQTITGACQILLEHGLNYEWKKTRLKTKQLLQHQRELMELGTVDQDQENDTRLKEIAQVKWANGENQ